MYKIKIKILGIILLAFLIPIEISYSQNSELQNDENLKSKKNQTGYIVNLEKLIDASKKKIKEVDDEILEQQIRERNLQREEKAREYYEQAMKYYESGKYEDAQKLWKKAIKITSHPEMQNYIRESTKKVKRQENAFKEEERRRLKILEMERGYSATEVEKKYQEGVALFQQKKYIQAKDVFDKVEEMFPDHKATRSYLMVIQQNVQKEQQKLIEDRLKEEAIAIRMKKNAWRKEIEKRENERRKKLEDQAELIYKQARHLYGARKYKQAKEKFQEVEWVLPNYKSTQNYLSRIDLDIETAEILSEKDKLDIYNEKLAEEQLALKNKAELEFKRKEKEETEKLKRIDEEAEFLYSAALALYKNGEYEKAQEKLNEVQGIYNDYKSVLGYLSDIDQKIFERERSFRLEKEKIIEAKEKEQRELESKKFALELKKKKSEHEQFVFHLEKEAEPIYKSAVALYKKGSFIKAKEKFEQLQEQYPFYKLTAQYLTDLNEKILDLEQKKFQREKIALERLIKEEAEKLRREKEKEILSAREKELKKIEEISQQAEFLYSSAVNLFKKQLYDQAKGKFEEVQQYYPNYKSTLDYITNIDKIILEEKIKKEEEERKLIAALEKEKNLAIEKERKLLKEKQDYLEIETAKKVKEEADFIYTTAVNLFKKGFYSQSKEKFEEVNKLYPGYLSTLEYITNIEEKIKIEAEKRLAQEMKIEELKLRQEELLRKKEEDKKARIEKEEEQEKIRLLQQEADFVYQTALSLFKKELFAQAKSKFEEVNNIYSNYKSTTDFLIKIDKKIKQIDEMQRQKEHRELEEKGRLELLAKKNEEELKKRLEGEEKERKENEIITKAETNYKIALKLYKDKLYLQSKEKFNEVNGIVLNYKSTVNYLSKIELKLLQQNEKLKRQEKKEFEKKAKIAEMARKKEEELKQKSFQEEIFKKEQISKLNERQTKAKFNEKSSKNINENNKQTVIKTILTKEEEALIMKEYESRRKKILEETEVTYKNAVDLYNSKDFIKAKEKFIRVETLIPDYKKNSFYLARIDEDIYEYFKTNEPKKEEPDQKQNNKIIPSLISVSYADENSENLTTVKDEPVIQTEIKTDTNKLYKQAVKEYKEKDFISANIILENILKIDTDNKKAIKLQQTIKNEVQKEEYKEPDKNTIGYQTVSQDYILKKQIQEQEENYKKTKEYRELKSKIEAEILAADKAKRLSEQKMEKRRRELKRELRVEKKEKIRREKEIMRSDLLRRKELEKNLRDERLKKIKEQKLKEENEKQFQLNKNKEEKEIKKQEEILARQKEQELKYQKEITEKEKYKNEKLDELNKESKEYKARKEEKMLALKKEKELKKQEKKRLIEERREKNLKEREEKKALKRKSIEDDMRKRQEEIAEKEKYKNEEKVKLEILNRKKEEDNNRKKEHLLAAKKEKELKKLEQKRLIKERKEKNLKEKEEKITLRNKSKKKDINKVQEKRKEEQKNNYETERIKNEFKDSALERIAKEERKKISKIQKQQQKIIKQQNYHIKKIIEKNNHEQKIRYSNDVKAIYNEAVQLMKEQKLIQAKVKFSLVEGISPGYKNAKQYISILENQIIKREQFLTKKKEIYVKKETLRFEKEQAELLAEKKKQEEIEKKKEYEEQKKKEKEQAELLAEKKKQEEIEKKKEYEEQKKKEKEQAELLVEKQNQEKISKKKEYAQKKEKEKQELIAKKAEALKKKEEALRTKREEAKKIEKARINAINTKKEILKSKAEIDKIFKEAIDLYKDKNNALAEEKFNKITSMLKEKNFEDKYSKKIENKILKERERIKQVVINEQKKQAEIARMREKEFILEQKRVELQKNNDLKKLEQQVKIKERRLEQIKKEEQRKILAEKQRIQKDEAKKKFEEDRIRLEKEKEKIAELKKIKELDSKKKKQEEPEKLKDSAINENNNYVSEKQQIKFSEQTRQKELEELVKKRQEELRLEREKIQKEFNRNIENLFKKANKLYKDGSFLEAKTIFIEIDNLKPNYRNTQNYLLKIDNELKRSEKKNNRHKSINNRQKIISEALDSFELVK